MNMLQIFTAGDEIGGYCNGYFGRDDYANKTCILVTPKFAVFSEQGTGLGSVLNYTEGLEDDAKDWKPEDLEDDAKDWEPEE